MERSPTLLSQPRGLRLTKKDLVGQEVCAKTIKLNDIYCNRDQGLSFPVQSGITLQ